LAEIYDLKAQTTAHRVWQVEANLAPIPDISDPDRWGSTEHTALRWLFFVEALKGCRRILDVGCGDGRPSLYIAPYFEHVVGVDISPGQIRLARRSAELMGLTNVRFEAADVAHLPFADGDFDGVCFGGNVLTYGPDQAPLLAEINRVLKPEGPFAFEQWPNLGDHPPGDRVAWFIDCQSPVLHVTSSNGPCSRDIFVFLKPETVQGQRLMELSKAETSELSSDQRRACEEIKREIEHGSVGIVQRAIYSGGSRCITKDEMLPVLRQAGFSKFECWALPDSRSFARSLDSSNVLSRLRKDDLIPMLRALVAASPRVSTWEFNSVRCFKA
jgi:SAM-dependent methyltransferase